MLCKDVCSKVVFSRDSLCNSPKELLQSRDFYSLMETYCNKASSADPKYNAMLDYYFNDEGYVDCWRIPHLMLDIYNDNKRYQEILIESPVFLSVFFDFLIGFYNFYMTLYKPYTVSSLGIVHTNDTVLHLIISKRQMSLTMDVFIKVVENLESWKSQVGGLI